jgi:glycerophosphoryl diester phosphodiesterase
LRGFETDVRMTRDGELVILHDDRMERSYAGTGTVESATAAELRPIKTKKTGQPFFFLDDLLTYFSDKPGVYLEFEMKTSNTNLYPEARLEAYCKKLHDTVTARRPQGSFYAFTSFDQRPLKIMKRLDPQADILLITGGACSNEFVQAALALGAKRVGCRVDLTSRAQVRAAQKAGLRVSCWPGRSVEDYELGLALGVDALCTDIPLAVTEWKKRKTAEK